MVCYYWGSRSPETACASAPAGRLGGELPDSGSTIGDEKQRPVPRLLYHASGTPPNVAENDNNMTCIVFCFYLFSSSGNLPLQSYWSLSCDDGLHCSDDLM